MTRPEESGMSVSVGPKALISVLSLPSLEHRESAHIGQSHGIVTWSLWEEHRLRGAKGQAGTKVRPGRGTWNCLLSLWAGSLPTPGHQFLCLPPAVP